MPIGVGLVGAGNISTQYLTNLTTYPDLKVVAIDDLIPERARAQAEKFGVDTWGGAGTVCANPEVEVVVNITPPEVHLSVSAQAIRAGKHVWSEKPLGLDRTAARTLLDEAAALGVQVCCAPDTVLGPGIQAALRSMDAGSIGRPLAGLAIMQVPGPDLWHPDPAFLFQTGAGPVLDIGPYYFTSLVLGLGPVTSVVAAGGRAREVRTVVSGPKAGTEFAVTVPTTANVLLRHASGASSVCLYSFDSGLARAGVLEFQGSTGTIVAPDPNMFDGTVRTHVGGELTGEVAIEAAGHGRGIGVVDLVRSLAEGRRPRLNGELAYHVLDIMLAVEESIASGEPVAVTSAPPAVDLLPDSWSPLSA
ncbi:MAG TPA: Gfo/Idh/MocA family oxidoreductase [Propionicimonas sp.]|nr:Gfo/Idh/MocA family oxidoreductase [Propionicimonas sp.]HQA77547.1 Gfo/Idh/MocA family oxidoreductase [Propionicimonas sp.]HQD96504.1 Gfo/Idh/MocA family oxidoreductase [Propionicimonas sp.]